MKMKPSKAEEKFMNELYDSIHKEEMKKIKLKNYIFYKTSMGDQYHGHVLDVLKVTPDESIDCIITSPPFWGLRDYQIKSQIWDGDKNCKHEWEIKEYINPKALGSVSKEAKVANTKKMLLKFRIKEGFCKKCGAWFGSLGLEPSFDLYLDHLIQIFKEVKRVLKKEGTCFINLGDSYNNQAMQIGRKDKVSGKSYSRLHSLNSGIKGYPGKCLTINSKAVKEGYEEARAQIPIEVRDNIHREGLGPGRNKRTVWRINTRGFSEKHFATFPEELIVPMIKSGCPKYICDKCGKIKKKIYKGKKETAFNVRIRDMKKGRKKYSGTHATKKEMLEYDMKKYHGKGKTWQWEQCNCGSTFTSGIVEDPFMGSGTVAKVCEKLGYKWAGIEISRKYNVLIKKRIIDEAIQGKLKL